MTGNQAIRILAWVEGTLKWASPDHLTPFERELLAKCREIEISIPGYGKAPTIEVGNIIPKMKVVLEDATVWEVESIHKVENNLYEILLIGTSGRQIIRKRHTTRMGYIRCQ